MALKSPSAINSLSCLITSSSLIIKSNFSIFSFSAYASIVRTSFAATKTLISVLIFEEGSIIFGLFCKKLAL